MESTTDRAENLTEYISNLMSVQDVAKTFGVDPQTVRKWCRENKINFIKLPGKKGAYRFSKKNLADFVVTRSSDKSSLIIEIKGQS